MVAHKRINLTAKEKPHGKKNNHDLTAKEIRINMSSRYRRNFAVSLFLFAVRFFFLPRVFFFLPHREVIVFAVSLFLFAMRLMLLP